MNLLDSARHVLAHGFAVIDDTGAVIPTPDAVYDNVEPYEDAPSSDCDPDVAAVLVTRWFGRPDKPTSRRERWWRCPECLAWLAPENARGAVDVDGIILDHVTANLVVQVCDRLNDANRAKLLAMDPVRAVDVCWKLVRP